jgi:hypothetical protein
MKLSALLLPLMAGILISGCVFHKHKTSASVPKGSSLIITPDTSLAARVVAYNATGRFVVLSFPIGQLPGLGQTFFVYHDGLKAGEVKISGPQRDNNIVADVVTGEAQAGDEVRDQ